MSFCNLNPIDYTKNNVAQTVEDFLFNFTKKRINILNGDQSTNDLCQDLSIDDYLRVFLKLKQRLWF